jgi:hypothetical protein
MAGAWGLLRDAVVLFPLTHPSSHTFIDAYRPVFIEETTTVFLAP